VLVIHDVGVRPAIVLLHGFTQTGASWRGVIDGLGERYTAFAPDIRGHGTAYASRPVGFRECVDDVLAATPGSFTLAGYSMGGRLALHVALAGADRVARLVLVGTGAGIADPVERAARARQDAELADQIEAATIESFADRWARNPVLKGQPPEVAAAAREDRLRNEPAGLAAALRGLGQGAMEPLWGRLRELRMPVTLIVGERDSKYRKLAERMAAALPESRLLVVPATGHAVHLEAPAIVAEAIAATSPQPAC
jgi:2-succinyl-6-hydroxy-2,4-cyclohexadiene-1-carboxylate synthase